MSTFMDTVWREFNRMRARSFTGEGYEGVTHAGIAVVAGESARVLLAQRAPDESDDPEVRETWEFPGGHLDSGEEPYAAALREFSEEVGLDLPEGDVVGGWRGGPEDNYQGFVYLIRDEIDLSGFMPNDETQAVGWFTREEVEEHQNLRPEMRDSTDWGMIFGVSGNEEDEMPDSLAAAAALTDTEPTITLADITPGAIPIHGVLAPEDVESGDARGFNDRALTRRAPLRLPFGWQKVMAEGHMGAITVGSIDRMMRKDGLIHWEGSLLDTPEAAEFMDLIVHFGRYGVSIDGDKGSLDPVRSKAEGGTWFAGARIAGATGCAIPAFQEAYVALGPHPEMPVEDDPEEAVLAASGLVTTDLIGKATYDRGPGWITNPRETERLHDYWTKPGQPGYEKINWGTNGDYRRCLTLVGEKIATNSPEDLRFMKRICAQWHHDALGYWPGDLGKPGNAPDTPENRKRAATHASVEAPDTITMDEEGDGWEAVLTSSAAVRALPPASYFDRHEDTGALVIEEPDENGVRRTYGYAGEWGVCHIGYDGRCVEMPEDPTGEFRDFHLGRTKVSGNEYLNTGVITYRVEHRDADTILSETATQAHFDNIEHAWASVRLGADDRGVWFSGVVLPHVPEEDIVLIEATGQVSGEWKYGAIRGLQAVNIPGFPVMRSSAAYDDEGNVVALVASAIGSGECEGTPKERIAALAAMDAEVRMARLRAQFEGK